VQTIIFKNSKFLLHRSLVTDSRTDTNISQLVYGGGGKGASESGRERQRPCCYTALLFLITKISAAFKVGL